MIPAILHQTWRTRSFDAQADEWFASWTRYNPKLDHRFYDDAACREFVLRCFPTLASVYDNLPFPVQKADLFRYLVVYEHGGLYADIDMECCAPLTDVFAANGAVLSVEARLSRARQHELAYRAPYQLANCIFAAEARHPFFAALIARVAELAATPRAGRRADVEDVTGPRVLTRLFYESAFPNTQVWRQTFLLPSRLYPRRFPFNRIVLTRHHFQGSWKQGETLTWRRRWRERDVPPNPFARTRLQRFPQISSVDRGETH